MPLSYNKQPIKDQLSQSFEKMADFLIKNPSNTPSNAQYYKTLYDKIEILEIKARTEGYSGFEHNPYTTLADFLNQNNTKELVVKYYSTYGWKKESTKPSKIKKAKKSIEWISRQISKCKTRY